MEFIMKKHILRIMSAMAIVLLAGQVMAQLCDNVFRQADKLIVKPETYNIVMKDKATFKIFLQNNMDQDIADISLIPDSLAFDFNVSPKQMAIPQNQRTFFEVTMTPRPAVKAGTFTVNFQLVGGKDQRLFKSFSMKWEDAGSNQAPPAATPGAATPRKQGRPDSRKPAARPAAANLLPIANVPRDTNLLVATARPTGTRPEIDGQLNDATWNKAAVLANFSTASGDQAIYDTTALVTFDAAHLYLGILCNDENAERLSDADSIEAIFTPSKPYSPSYSIKVTALNTPSLKMFLTDGTATDWPASGISFAVEKAKRAWMLELAIPLTALGANAPKNPELWQLRINRTKAGGNTEQSYWSADSAGINSAKGLGVIRLQP